MAESVKQYAKWVACNSQSDALPFLVYLPGIGRRGYDPARGLAVSKGRVAAAAGFDFDLASPVAGWYSGGARSQMEASLSLQVDDAG